MKKYLLITSLVLCPYFLLTSCTIFSVKDNAGHVWTINNEDNPYNFYNYINIFPKTEDSKFGFYTLSYDTPENGENFNIQGGFNEAGLFLDFNTIRATPIKNIHEKKSFPKGSQNILTYILGNLEKTEQVVAFFDQYWFDVGFNSAQMHVADKFGTFAIIGPSGSRILKNESMQISTNFDICGREDSSNCWRYPILKEFLNASLTSEELKELAEKVSFRGQDWTHTIYTNIQNLQTGEIQLYFSGDYNNGFFTSLPELLKKGRKSLLIRDLFPEHPVSIIYNELRNNGGYAALKKLKMLELSETFEKEILAIFVNTELYHNYNMDVIPLLDAYLEFDPIGYWMTARKAIYHFQLGNIDKAKSLIVEYKDTYPNTSMDVDQILGRFDGEFTEQSNATILLHGYPNAKHVFVKGLPVEFSFMTKQDDYWYAKFELPDGVYNYSFIVDGVEVFDEKTPIIQTNSIFEASKRTHRLGVNMGVEYYLTTIRVKVPEETDVVYIAGNQPNLGNWNSVFRLTKTAPKEREISVLLHLPAAFKFTKGSWSSEAVMENAITDDKGMLRPIIIDLETKHRDTLYEINSWKQNN